MQNVNQVVFRHWEGWYQAVQVEKQDGILKHDKTLESLCPLNYRRCCCFWFSLLAGWYKVHQANSETTKFPSTKTISNGVGVLNLGFRNHCPSIKTLASSQIFQKHNLQVILKI